MTREQLMLGFIHEAEEAFECEMDLYAETGMHMLNSDHGYDEWIIFPLSIQVGNEQAVLTVEDAGESQRRFILTVMDEDPFMLVHTYFLSDDVQTYEISRQGRIHK